MIEVKPFTLPADVAEFCKKGSAALASSERMLRLEIEIWGNGEDPSDPEWECHIEHGKVERCADNLKRAQEFLLWLSQFAEHGGGDA